MSAFATDPNRSKPVEHSAAVLAGPIKSERTDGITTVWRDGEVWRQDQFGRAHRLPNIKPIFPIT